ncbi:DegT/DnrJ/EryC1/StrS family aminotransferase [Candidatus Omnitrophota bacterium]
MGPIPLVDLKLQYKTIESEIKKAIEDIFAQGVFISGKPLVEFEKGFSKFCGTKYAVGVSSGTSALYLALLACNVGKGDEVITVPNTFIATTEAITAAGARPVFVDIDPEDYTIDVSKIKKAISKKTKAIIPVHIYGHLANMDAILSLAKEHGLKVIEDAAQSHGAEHKGKRAGSLGDAGCFSFYPGKNLGAYGDAGALTTNDAAIAEKVSLLRNHGRKEKYSHIIEGFNNRLDTLQAKLLSVKLAYLEDWNKSRRQVAQWYRKYLKDLSLKLPKEDKDYLDVYHLFVIETDDRDGLLSHLKEKGIFAGIHYPIPLHLQEAYKYLGYKQGDFPVTEHSSKRILSLPIFPELEESSVEFICKTIKEFIS